MAADGRRHSIVTRNSGAAEFTRHRGPVTCVAGVPGTRQAVTSGYDGAVGLFHLDTGAVELLGYHAHLVNRVTIDRNGTRAASSSSDYQVHIWDLERRCLERVLCGHSDDVEDFAFVSDRVGVSVSRDQRILIWDLVTGAILRCIEEHEKDVLAVVAAGGQIYTSLVAIIVIGCRCGLVWHRGRKGNGFALALSVPIIAAFSSVLTGGRLVSWR
jgi:WD40 repeat protein